MLKTLVKVLQYLTNFKSVTLFVSSELLLNKADYFLK